MSNGTEKLLTIIVPTYNRKDSLAKGLDAILPQIEAHIDCVRLYVSDNCSDDGTEQFIRELQFKHPGIIQYKRQEHNLGAQGNFKDAVQSVESKFVAIFSDDDIALPCYVEMILEQLQKHSDIGLVNYNALCVSPNGRYIGVRDPLVVYGHPKYYAIGGEFIKEHTHVPSLVSSNVFDRQAFVAAIGDISPDDYPGYGWFAILMKSIIGKPCIYIDQPLFLQYQPEHQRWEKNAAWYCAYGLSHLFSDLDAMHNGIWNAWTEKFSHNGYVQVCFELIAKYQQEYVNRYKTLLKYSAAEEFSRNLKYYVFYSARHRYLILNIWPRFVKRARRILHV